MPVTTAPARTPSRAPEVPAPPVRVPAAVPAALVPAPPAAAPRTRAAVLTRPGGPFEVREVAVAVPRPDEAVVRVVAVGLCRCDVASWVEGVSRHADGVGHEVAGVVERVGADVVDVRPGDQVLVTFAACGSCDACVDGHPAYCTSRRPGGPRAGLGDPAGVGAQPSFAGHVTVPASRLVAVGPGADLTLLAAVGCSTLTGCGAVWNVLAPEPGARLAVFGADAVGLSAVVAAAATEPAVLVAVDLEPERLELALELGATHALHARADDVAERVVEITGGGGLTGVVDATGDPRVIGAALATLAVRGELVTCGAPVPGAEVRVGLPSVLGGRVLRGATLGDADPRRLLPRIARLVADGLMPVERLVHRYDLADLGRALRDLHGARTVKPVVVL